ncbi:MAG: SRPBCC family protein [Actinomycetales bacterium]|nr:SRPBCC family protein [Actinomycetales bacterium]
MSSRGSSASAEAIAPAPPAATFAVVAPADPARFYPRFGPLPAVTAVPGWDGRWDAPGQTRRLELSDGSSVVEHLDVVEPETHVAYHLDSFTGLFGRLVERAEADWRFAPEASASTRIRWSYRYIARRGFGPIVAAIVRLFWAPYMRRVLPGLVAEVARVAD